MILSKKIAQVQSFSPRLWQTSDQAIVKFMFSKKVTKIDEIFTVDLTLCSKCQIDGEDLVNFCGLFRKHELHLLNELNRLFKVWIN